MKFLFFPLFALLLLLPAYSSAQESFQQGFSDGSAHTTAFITQSLRGCEYGLASSGTNYASGYDSTIDPSGGGFSDSQFTSFDPNQVVNSTLPGGGVNSYTTQCTDPLRAYLVDMAGIINGRIRDSAPFSNEWLYWTGYKAGYDFAAVRWLSCRFIYYTRSGTVEDKYSDTGSSVRGAILNGLRKANLSGHMPGFS